MQKSNAVATDGNPMNAFRLGHRPALDGLRAIFVVLVLAVHSGIPFMQGAGLGVDCFFVLSGFLITSLLLQEWNARGSISLKRFYIRRALRLLPALYAMLALAGLITVVSLKGEGAIATERGIMLSAVYASNWVVVLFPDFSIGLGLMSHSWSLAVEEQFYLVWPFVLLGLLFLRLKGRPLVISIAFLAILSAVWRFWLLENGTFTARLDFGSDTRADGLLIGCALGAVAAGGMLVPSERVAGVTRWLALLGAGVLTFLVIDSSVSQSLLLYYGLYTLIALCVVAILGHLLVSPQGRIARLLSWKPLVQLGTVSYGIYLWHNPVFHLISTGSVGWLNWPVQLIRLVITAVLVTISYRYLEKPALRLKERFSNSSPFVPPLPQPHMWHIAKRRKAPL